MIIAGNTIVAFGLTNLLVAHNIITGGVAGIGLVVNHYLGLPLAATVGILNVVLFIAGFIVFGKEFSLKTVISTFYFPLAIAFFQSRPNFIGGLSDLLIVSVLAGCCIGLGVGLIIRANGSSGGIDTLALLITKFVDRPVALILNLIDIAILSLQMPFNDINHIMYGIVTVVITALVMNQTLTQGDGLQQVLIISDKYEELRETILFDQDSGLTMLHSVKGYTQKPTCVLMSVIPLRKLPEFKRQINAVDPDAFIVVTAVKDIACKGYSQLRAN